MSRQNRYFIVELLQCVASLIVGLWACSVLIGEGYVAQGLSLLPIVIFGSSAAIFFTIKYKDYQGLKRFNPLLLSKGMI